MPRVVRKENTNTIGKRIKEARYQKRLSQHELAKILGFKSQAHVSGHETDLMAPGEKTLKKYAQALDVTISWLRYGIDSQNTNSLDVPKITEEEILKKINTLENELYLLKNLVMSAVETIKVLANKDISNNSKN